jgi:hypothetical protein
VDSADVEEQILAEAEAEIAEEPAPATTEGDQHG